MIELVNALIGHDKVRIGAVAVTSINQLRREGGVQGKYAIKMEWSIF